MIQIFAPKVVPNSRSVPTEKGMYLFQDSNWYRLK